MDTMLNKNTCFPLIQLVKYYHGVRPKFKNKEICSIINNHHEISLSPRQLKELMRKNGLRRVRNINDSTLRDLIKLEMTTSACKLGYKQLTEIVSVKYDVNLSKESVRLALKVVDPEGVEERKRKTIMRRIYDTEGPGDVYHLDGNDKLMVLLSTAVRRI